jgi:hypothetical protein
MANMQQPSPRTCHLDIKQFAIIDWVEQEQDQCVHSSQGYISATWRYSCEGIHSSYHTFIHRKFMSCSELGGG